MREFLGTALDVILIGVVLEALLLWWAGRRGLHGLRPMGWLPNLAAGFLLMLAIRLTLADRIDLVIALILPGSLIVHVLDLRGRLRSANKT